jgi:hypothetical protein
LFYAWTDDRQTWLPAQEQRVPFHVFEQTGGGGSLGLDPDGQSLHLIVGQDLSGSPEGGINRALYFRYAAGQWSAPEAIATDGFGYNLAVGPDGRVHAVWSDSDVWYRVRTTAGVWERARRLVFDGWHPDIDIGTDGRVHVAYNGNGLCCAASWVEVSYLHSGDGGATWQAPERLTFDTVWTGAAVGAADAWGGYHLAYLIRGAYEGDLYHRYRRPYGSWTPPKLVFQAIRSGQTGYDSPSLEVDPAGNLVSLFSCAVPGQANTVCLRARTWQGRWLDARRLSIFGVASPSLAGGVFDAGHVDAVWSSQGYLIHRLIDDLACPATPTPTPTPTATPAAYHARVVDDTGLPRGGARVYRNGSFAGLTRADGVLNFETLTEGDELIALAPLPLDVAMTSGRTVRIGHDHDLDTGATVEPWAFQVFLTNLRQSRDFGPLPPDPLANGAPGERRIVVHRDSALILLNLTVSIEWDADQAYLDDLE